MNTGIRLPFITRESGPFLRVRAYKLARIPEGKPLRSPAPQRSVLRQQSRTGCAKDREAIREGNVLRFLPGKRVKWDPDREFREREQRRVPDSDLGWPS
jgi:hypothetical protein